MPAGMDTIPPPALPAIPCCSGGGRSAGSLLMDYSLVLMHLCPLGFLSDREQHQKHLFGVESLCCSTWEELHCQEHQTSLPKPPTQTAKRMAMYILLYKFHGNLLSGSPCFHILYQPQLPKTWHSGILMDGSGCRNAFLYINSIMMKGPVWQEQLLFALFLGLVECPTQKDPMFFFITSTVINDR